MVPNFDNDQEDSHRRRLHASVASDRLHARHHARRHPWRRADGRCVLRRLPAAEPFPRHLRRRRVQCRFHSGLCAGSHPGRRERGGPVRRPHLHAVVGVAGRAAGAGAAVHPASDRAAGARLLARAASICAGGVADADHVSLSAPDHAGDAMERHSQRPAPFRGRGRGADPAQSHHDGDVGLSPHSSLAPATPRPGVC